MYLVIMTVNDSFYARSCHSGRIHYNRNNDTGIVILIVIVIVIVIVIIIIIIIIIVIVIKERGRHEHHFKADCRTCRHHKIHCG